MIKNKIAAKLTLYFSIALISFSLIISFMFMFLFTNHITNQHKKDLEKKAVSISERLSNFMGYNSNSGHMGMPGYGAYMRFLDDIAMTDVWIVDENMNIITRDFKDGNFSYKDLPKGAEDVIKNVFKGEISFSESFSDVLNTKTITVGTPIKNESGKIIGSVLLHSGVEGISSALSNSFGTLIISILVALFTSGIIAIALSIKFTKPLNKMKDTAISLSSGDYRAKTNVNQEDEIGELASTIDMLSEKLYISSKESENLEKMRRDFISNISHELRTPVTVIRGSLEAICDGIIKSPEKLDEYHNQMLLESIHMQRLVNDLLDLSKLQNPDFKMEMSPLNISDLLIDVSRGMKPLANKKEIHISLEDSINNYEIIGDYGRLRQMLTIVIDNSIKFSPKHKTIYITLTNNNKLKLSIKDKGCGISPDEIPYIFDRFHKTNLQENKNGTGLGLAIAKEIANRHGIKILVKSELHNYTEFIFEF